MTTKTTVPVPTREQIDLGRRKQSNRGLAFHAPVLRFIGDGDATKKLYALEDKLTESFKSTADELHRVLVAHDLIGADTSKWQTSIPEELLHMLEEFGDSGIAAAVSYLTVCGWTLTPPTEEE